MGSGLSLFLTFILYYLQEFFGGIEIEAEESWHMADVWQTMYCYMKYILIHLENKIINCMVFDHTGIRKQ